MATEELILKARIEDGVTKSLKDISKAASAMGASVDETRAVMSSLDKTATSLGIPLSKAKEAFKGLVRETEDATEATKHLGVAMQYQLATGINSTAAAAKDIGDVLGGGTRALRQFDARAAAAADAIDKIKDPARRAELAMEALTDAIKRQGSPLQRASNRLNDLNARLTASGPAGRVAAAALANLHTAALALAVGGLAMAAAAWKKYNDSTAEGKIRNQQAKSATDALTISFGRLIENITDASSQYTRTVAAVNELTDGIGDADKATDGWTTALIRHANPISVAITYSAQLGQGIRDLVFGTEEYDKLIREQSIPALEALGASFIDTAGGIDVMAGSLRSAADWANNLYKAAKKAADELAKLPTEKEVANRLAGKKAKEENTQIHEANMLRRGKGKGIKDTSGGGSKGGGGGGGAPKGWQAESDLLEKAALRIVEAKRKQEEIQTRINLQAMAALSLTEKNADLQEWAASGGIEREAAWAEAKERTALAIKEQNRAAQDLANTLSGAFYQAGQSAVSVMVSLGDQLASNTLKLKDLGASAANAAGDILIQLGEEVGGFGVLFGGLMSLIGDSMRALVTNPWALGAIGLAVVGAGFALKAFGSKGQGVKGSAQRASSAASAGVERFARTMTDRGTQEEDRKVTLNVDGYEMGAYLRTQDNERARRRHTRSY